MAGATKKREARKSLQQPGWITLDGGFAARPCVVQDLSSSGAKITIDDFNSLPGRLRLAFRAMHGPGGTAKWSGAGASRRASSSSASESSQRGPDYAVQIYAVQVQHVQA